MEVVNTNGGTLSVMKMPGDGNCLFSSIAYQIEKFRVGSSTHKIRVSELRCRVVQYMKANISNERLRNCIICRIIDEMPSWGKLIERLKYEKFFDFLEQDRNWGGEETIIATMLMLNVKMVIHFEGGNTITFTVDNSNLETGEIHLVYRLAAQSKNCYNHYDSLEKGLEDRALLTGISQASEDESELEDRSNTGMKIAESLESKPSQLSKIGNMPGDKIANIKSNDNLFPVIRVGTWHINHLLFNVQKISEIENLIIKNRLEMCCLHGKIEGVCELSKINISHVVYRSQSRQSIIIISKEINCVETHLPEDLAKFFDSYSLLFSNGKELVVLILNNLEEQTITEAEQLFNNLTSEVIVFGNVEAQLGKNDRALEDVEIIGQQLYHERCNYKGALLKKLALLNNLSIRDTFSKSNTLKTTQLKNKVWFQNSHILATKTKSRIWVTNALELNHISNDKMLLAKIGIETDNSYRTADEQIPLSSINHIHQVVGHQGFYLKPHTHSQELLSKDTVEDEYLKESSKLNIGSWNVRGCVRDTDRNEIDEVLCSNNIYIVGLQETHLATGKAFTNKFNWYCSGGQDPKVKRGVAILVRKCSYLKVIHFNSISENICTAVIECYWDKSVKTTITLIVSHVPSQGDNRMSAVFKEIATVLGGCILKSNLILLGDFNAHIGKNNITADELQFIGRNLYHNNNNENGEFLKILAAQHSLVIHTTKSSKRYNGSPITWSNGRSASQIDHILMRKSTELQVAYAWGKWVKYRTDHKLIAVKIKLNTVSKAGIMSSQKFKEAKQRSMGQTSILKISRECLESLKIKNQRDLYNMEVIRLYNAAKQQGTSGKVVEKYLEWNEVCQIIISSANRTLTKAKTPLSPKRRKALAAVLSHSFKVKQSPLNQNLKKLLKEARDRLRVAKKEHENKKCVEFFANINDFRVGERIKKTYMFLRKYKNEVKDKDKAGYLPISQWIKELDTPGNSCKVEFIRESDHWPLEEPPSDWDIEEAICQIKSGKAAGLDSIFPEMLTHAPYVIKVELSQIITQAWCKNEIPKEWKQSIQFPIPKIKNPKTTNDYRRISLCSIAYKIYAKLLLTKLETKMNDIPEYQAAFINNRSCDDHMFTIRRILEEQWRKGKLTFVLSLDLEKAFDKVNLQKMVHALEALSIPCFLINRIIEATMRETSCLKWFGQLTPMRNKTVGIKQGCPLSPRLFTMLLHVVLVRLQDKVNLFTLEQKYHLKLPVVLAFADDLILIAEKRNEISTILEELILQLAEVGLNLNFNKCEVLVKNPLKKDLTRTEEIFGKFTIKRVSQIKYLGTYITEDLSRRETIAKRCKSAVRASKSIIGFIKSNNIRWESARLIYKAVLAPMMLYGLKDAALTKQNRSRLRVYERMMVASVLEACSNKDMYKHLKTTSLLDGKTITKRVKVARIKYWGHINRRPQNSLLRLAQDFKRGGKKKIGRPCLTWNDSIKDDKKSFRLSSAEWEELVRDKALLKKEAELLYLRGETSDSE